MIFVKTRLHSLRDCIVRQAWKLVPGAVVVSCRRRLLRSQTDTGCRACERSVSGAENGAERTEYRLERSGEVSKVQKIKWSVSEAGAGGRRNGNGAVSGLHLPLKIRSTTKALM